MPIGCSPIIMLNSTVTGILRYFTRGSADIYQDIGYPSSVILTYS
jgi:hypothetical protein